MRTLRVRVTTEDGTSLAEILVVILILGIIAAFALPAFTGHQLKAHDTDAKSNARTAAAAVDACYGDRRDYTACDTARELGEAGSRIGTPLTDTATKQPGAVSLTATRDTYVIVAYSVSSNTFTVTRRADGSSTRTCTTARRGACRVGEVW